MISKNLTNTLGLTFGDIFVIMNWTIAHWNLLGMKRNEETKQKIQK